MEPDKQAGHVNHNIMGCARCGKDHQMTFYRFKENPITDRDEIIWEWWGLCPNMNEPVLLRDLPEGHDYEGWQI